MNEELQAVCIQKLKGIISLCENESETSNEDINFKISSILVIFQNCPEQFGLDVVIDLLSEAIGILDKDSALSDCSLQYKYAPCGVLNGMKGRPKWHIPPEMLEYYVDSEFTLSQMSCLIGVSKSTVRRRLEEMNISISCKYSLINDEQLDENVKRIIHDFPNIGYRTVKGHLASLGYTIQQNRVKESMRRVDFEGVLCRHLLLKPVHRRVYNVRAPLSLWHIDGYHKLISWRLVIHGGIDGYSRLPVYLKVKDNNRAEVVLQAFKEAVEEYGLPERVRSDKGGENVKVAEFMLMNHGLEKKCFITGRSVHNQRIERFWRDLWDGCICLFYNIFAYLECQNLLDVNNEFHMKALHFVFIPRIQDHLDRFRAAFMRRPLRTANYRTPLQLWISGQILDPKDDLSEEEFQSFGVDQPTYEPCSNDIESVHVSPPEIQDARMNMDLQKLLDPLQDSDVYGIDLFIQARDFLSNYVH